MRHSFRRTLVQALIVSVLIHVVILLRVAGLSPVQLNAPGATINVVVRPDSHGVPAKPVSTPVARPRAEPVKPASPASRNITTPQLVVPESSSSVASAEPAPIQPDVKSQNASVVSLDTRAGSGGALSAAIPEPVRGAINPDDRRNYRMSLAMAADRINAKRYPKLAKERGWEGIVEMTVTGSSLLPKPEVELVHSSGQRILDEHALNVMSQAVRATTLPESMKGRDFSEPMKWVFELKDAQ